MKEQFSYEDELIEQHQIWTWVKAHKKQLIAAGISITVLVGIILGMKNKGTFSDLLKTLHKAVAKNPAPTISNPVRAVSSTPIKKLEPHTNIIDIPITKPDCPSFDVRFHLRNLPDGINEYQAKKSELH